MLWKTVRGYLSKRLLWLCNWTMARILFTHLHLSTHTAKRSLQTASSQTFVGVWEDPQQFWLPIHFRTMVWPNSAIPSYSQVLTWHTGLNTGKPYNGFDGGYNRKHSGGDDSSSEYDHRSHYRHKYSDESFSSSSKKRRYPGHRQREGAFENLPAVPTRRFQDLLIGNTNEVEQFYFTRFKDMQQSSCKIMGKVFVKLLEPKKQTHYPYTKGAAQKPPWWPACTDSTGVPHREPDHLLKPG